VLALGDSLTAGYGLAAHQSFAARLEALLRERWPGADVHNAGVSRDTTADATRRLPRVLAALTRRPDLAIVELGANDLLRGLTAVETRANLNMIVEELARCAIPVLLATLEVPAFLAGVAGAHATLYAEVAASHGLPTYPFFPPGIMGHPEMVLADRLHPNARAIDRIAHHMLPAVVAAIEAQPV